MKSRVMALRKTIVKFFEPNKKKFASKPATYCDAHMNELPIPCGPWDIYYKDKQAFYTKHLVLGALWLLFSIATVVYTEALFWNACPPLWPDPPLPMDGGDDECETID